MLRVEEVAKTFTMHLQGGARLPVLERLSLAVDAGECVALVGPSGAGKSTLLRVIYGNYRCDAGRVLVRDAATEVDVADAGPRRILALRRRTLGYVSQFLRVMPRVGAAELVAEAARAFGHPADAAMDRAEALLDRLNIPRRLWALAPATFSGGEQQRINIARGFAGDHPILLLDEPTASLDIENAGRVVELINERKRAGAALLGIFHDPAIRDSVADRKVEMKRAA
jgi:alpha-D-ribose 1-methylphosphonate 5-triphosphate synthase subunit PhnL